jgi:type VI secretion system protein ImpH
MARPDRQSKGSVSVEEELFSAGYRFDFYQAVALLERLRPDALPIGETAEPEAEAVRFRSRVSFGFPPSDVAGISRAGDKAVLEATFMTLAGVHGPLPNAVAEVVLQRSHRKDTAFRDFLDIFAHRLISLMYRVRRKTRPYIGFHHPHESSLSHYLFSFLGLGTGWLRERMGVQDRALLTYIGLLVGRVRSQPGLEILLSHYFGVSVRVQPFVGRWLFLDQSQQTAIGRENSELGLSVVLGSRVWEQQSHFLIRLGPLSLDQFHNFLPIGRGCRPLMALTRFYAGEQLDFSIALDLKPAERPQAKLGRGDGSLLGWTSWLSGQAGDSVVVLHPSSLESKQRT